jgi:hypothetical protein
MDQGLGRAKARVTGPVMDLGLETVREMAQGQGPEMDQVTGQDLDQDRDPGWDLGLDLGLDRGLDRGPDLDPVPGMKAGRHPTHLPDHRLCCLLVRWGAQIYFHRYRSPDN